MRFGGSAPHLPPLIFPYRAMKGDAAPGGALSVGQARRMVEQLRMEAAMGRTKGGGGGTRATGGGRRGGGVKGHRIGVMGPGVDRG